MLPHYWIQNLPIAILDRFRIRCGLFSSGTVGEKTIRVVVVETDYVDFSLGITDRGLQVH